MTAASTKLHDAPYVLGCMERWARRRLGAGGGDISPTGRIMLSIRANICPQWIDDMQNQRAHDPFCPKCKGRGRLPGTLSAVKQTREVCPVCDGKRADGKSYTEFAGKECFRCKGEGHIVFTDLKINPATIKSTSHQGGRYIADATSEMIETTWRNWGSYDETFWHHDIVFREYFWVGTREVKALGGRKRPSVSPSFYSRTLKDALRRIEVVLETV